MLGADYATAHLSSGEAFLSGLDRRDWGIFRTPRRLENICDVGSATLTGAGPHRAGRPKLYGN